MSNPFKALNKPLAQRDETDEPLKPEAAESASNNCHQDVYHLQVQKSHKLDETHLKDGKLKSLKAEAQSVDNTAILQLSKEERQERFEHAVSVKLGQPWDHLAHQIAICRDDYVNNNGEEDSGYYRRRRFKRQTEVTLNEVPTDKFYFQAKCCARTAISKSSLNEFATIAEYYGFGVKERPITVTEDIEQAVKKKEADDNISPYYGGSTERSLSSDPNRCVLGIRLKDGTQYRFTQTENGQKIFRDKDGLWLCTDSKEPMTPETFSGQTHSWILYKQQDNPDVYLQQGATKQFAIKVDSTNGVLQQIFEDGTIKEITSDGVKITNPVKSGS